MLLLTFLCQIYKRSYKSAEKAFLEMFHPSQCNMIKSDCVAAAAAVVDYVSFSRFATEYFFPQKNRLPASTDEAVVERRT